MINGLLYVDIDFKPVMTCHGATTEKNYKCGPRGGLVPACKGVQYFILLTFQLGGCGNLLSGVIKNIKYQLFNTHNERENFSRTWYFSQVTKVLQKVQNTELLSYWFLIIK